MKIQLVAPWHSMTERPDVEKYVTFLGWKGADRLPYMHTAFFDYKQQMAHFFRNWTALDDFAYFAWAYKDDLAASEIRRMLVKETAQDVPSVRYVGPGGSGYSRTGFGSAGGGGTSYGFMGGSGSGGSSHGSSIGGNGGGMSPDGMAIQRDGSSAAFDWRDGVNPGWGVAGDMSQMRWPIGGIPGAYPQEKAEKEQD